MLLISSLTIGSHGFLSALLGTHHMKCSIDQKADEEEKVAISYSNTCSNFQKLEKCLLGKKRLLPQLDNGLI